MGKMMKDLHYRIWGLHVVLGQNIQVPALRRQMATEEGKEKTAARICVSSGDFNNVKTEDTIK